MDMRMYVWNCMVLADKIPHGILFENSKRIPL